MGCQDQTVTLGRQSSFESEPSGKPRIYWSNFVPTRGAAAIRLEFFFAQLPTDAIVRLRAQKSVDGINVATVGTGAGYIDGTTSGITTTTLRTGSTYSFQYSGTPDEYTGFIRFGLQVECSTADTMATTVLSATATLLASPRPQPFSGSASVAGTEIALLSDIASAAFDRARVMIDFTTAPGFGNSLLVNIYSGTYPSGTGTQALVASLSISDPRTSGSVEITTPGQYLTVKAIGLGGSWPTQSVHCALQLRPE